MKKLALVLSLLMLLPVSEAFAKKKVRKAKKARASHSRVVRAKKVHVPTQGVSISEPPSEDSPVWDFWVAVVEAREKLDAGKNQEAYDLMKDLLDDRPTPPTDVINKNQRFYRSLYKEGLETGLTAAERLSEPTEAWRNKLWALFPDFEDVILADIPEGMRYRERATRAHLLSQKSQFDTIPRLISAPETEDSVLPAMEKCRAQFELAWALQKLDRRDEASGVYDRVDSDDCDEKIRARALYWKGVAESGMKLDESAEETYRRLAALSGDNRYTDDAYYRLYTIYLKRNDGDRADEAAKKLVRLPAGDMKEKYLWDKAWEAYQAKDYNDALRNLEAVLASGDTGTEARPQALYWKGRIDEIRSGKKLGEGSSGLYKKLLKDYPFSFYALLAEARTGASAAVPAVAKLKSEPSADKKVTAAFGVVEKLIRKNDFGRAADALDYLTHLYPEAVKERPEAVAELWVGAGDYNRALEIASEYLDKSVFDINLAHESPLTRALYPLAYLDSAKKEADKNHLPLPLILGIMREESLFLRGVRSHAGAIGVMQLMPATARIKARGLGVPFDTVNLSDPADNILLGASFLKDLMDRFKEQTPLAVMGYNAGPGNVTKWMGAQGYLPLDEFVEAIPFTETRGYVKRVLRSAHIYGHLLGRTKRSALVPSMDLQP